MGICARVRILGFGIVHGRGTARNRFLVRHTRRQPLRGSRGGGERAREQRASKDWRGSGGRLEKIVPSRGKVHRSGTLESSRGGLVSLEGCLGLASWTRVA